MAFTVPHSPSPNMDVALVMPWGIRTEIMMLVGVSLLLTLLWVCKRGEVLRARRAGCRPQAWSRLPEVVSPLP